jgi:hypothetical protein
MPRSHAQYGRASRSAAERDCYPCRREVFDRGAPARQTWRSALRSVLLFVLNSLLITRFPPSYNKLAGSRSRTAFAQQDGRPRRREAPCRDIRECLVRQKGESTYNCESNRGSTHLHVQQGFSAPDAWVIEDEGHRGATHVSKSSLTINPFLRRRGACELPVAATQA